eukprot:CAMPEP_0169469044 /NCGR_PEP_ID=MMETSP1042-20121227/23253_1 /TAXON_ID=464988 /ORGANISM="Hemiselmis andersenii, Strain CCMP1180" /LENGTH=53 /DNA_ID=CAMNT_0009582461 /DNA_START=180 /DNA_END=341 /DNA_ORIENTATION=-
MSGLIALSITLWERDTQPTVFSNHVLSLSPEVTRDPITTSASRATFGPPVSIK